MEPTIGQVMAAYAADAVKHAEKVGIRLDFSEQSLTDVDSILWQIAGNDVIKPQSQAEQDHLWTLSKMYGGYLGEVVIRTMGGAWEGQNLPDGSIRVVLRSHGVQMFPPEKIYKRLTEEIYSGVAGYCRALGIIIERQNESK
jgi:hypothetical protein